MTFGLKIFQMDNNIARINARVCWIKAPNAIVKVIRTLRKYQVFQNLIFLNFIIKRTRPVPIKIAIRMYMKDVVSSIGGLSIS